MLWTTGYRNQGNKVLKKKKSLDHSPDYAPHYILKKLELHCYSKYHSHWDFLGLCRRIRAKGKWEIVLHIEVCQDIACCATGYAAVQREKKSRDKMHLWFLLEGMVYPLLNKKNTLFWVKHIQKNTSRSKDIEYTCKKWTSVISISILAKHCYIILSFPIPCSYPSC